MAYEFVIGVLITTAMYQWLGKRHFRRLYKEQKQLTNRAIEGAKLSHETNQRLMKNSIWIGFQKPSPRSLNDVLDDDVLT